MRSLFVKILLWFILTVVVAVSGTFYVSGILQRRQQQQRYHQRNGSRTRKHHAGITRH